MALLHPLHLLSHPQDRQNGSKPFIPSCADPWGPTHPILAHPNSCLCCTCLFSPAHYKPCSPNLPLYPQLCFTLLSRLLCISSYQPSQATSILFCGYCSSTNKPQSLTTTLSSGFIATLYVTRLTFRLHTITHL